MLILDYPDWDQPMLFEEFIPKVVFEMTEELSRIGKTPMHKRLCRIPMELDVPTPTALKKITKKYGEEIEKNSTTISLCHFEIRKS